MIKNCKIKNSDFFLLGLMYARGNFLGKREKTIAIYFTFDEVELADNIKKIIPEYISQKIIKISKHKKIHAIYFPSRMGEKMKETFKIDKQTISDRKLTKAILLGEEDKAKDFISGIMCINVSIKTKGFLFWKKKIFEFKEQSIEFLEYIGNFLKKSDIPFTIKDNSKNSVFFGSKKIPQISFLTIKEEHFKKLNDKIYFANPKINII